VRVDVSVGVGVRVGVGVDVGVRVGVKVTVRAGPGVAVSDGAAVGDGVLAGLRQPMTVKAKASETAMILQPNVLRLIPLLCPHWRGLSTL